LLFFISSRRRHTRCYRDWSSDVCLPIYIGALALGGGLAVAAFMTGHWLVLPLIGIVFLAEGASSYVQIGYFKLTGGKRIFRMAQIGRASCRVRVEEQVVA